MTLRGKPEISIVLGEIDRNSSAVFLLDGSSILNKHSFFQMASRILPQDPPLISDNLDAFVDSISSGILDCEANKLYILWTCADIMDNNAPEDFKMIIECFNDIIIRVAKEETQLFLFLFGSETI
ncbi:barstar family protein [Paenibacillus sp. SC116]|uniref:barstar family protein n=1 Tax=Paenibacillus sp. SC116 TaxID=2968986 RepID=UPI00215ADB1E|nr:barstar family protein [Paenibacillus sp. SC116]MCR8845349.1 barstar family protein [Paenibacillus sp. SC116]